MKNFIRYECTNCLRSIDLAVNLTHTTPDLCIITKGCEGRIFPVEAKSSISIASTPVAGVEEWTPRNSKKLAPPDVDRPVITVSTSFSNENAEGVTLITGGKGQIVFAAPPSFGEFRDMPNELNVSFNVVDDTPTTYKSFIFRQSLPFSVISGKESGLGGKVLRYNLLGTEPDTVEVKVNGVVRDRGFGPDDYQLFDGESDVLQNSITFNTPIQPNGITQIDVTVSKLAVRKQRSITFRKQGELDESRMKDGAYENVNHILRFEKLPEGGADWVKYQLYVADLDSTGLPINTAFAPQLVQESSGVVDFNRAMFLLALKPYTHLDRYLSIVAPFKSFDITKDSVIRYMKNRQLDANTLTVDVKSVEPVFPPLNPILFKTEGLIKSGLRGDSEQSTLDNGIIVGPDV